MLNHKEGIMGVYINKGNDGFRRALNGDYVDKTGMIAIINKTLDTERAFTCVTRSRRFGKSLAAKMLLAYYDKSCDSRSLFHGFEIENDTTFNEYINKYPVIFLDITDFITKYPNDPNIVTYIQESVIKELLSIYPEIHRDSDDDLMDILIKIKGLTNEKFIMIIDEWDAICREYDKTPDIMDIYVNLLRRLFKGSCSTDVFVGAYMTGILPIKRYKTQSALNNFREYSVINPGKLDRFFGFTPSEVAKLSDGEDVSMDELQKWYDGYSIGSQSSIYNPYSVIEAIHQGRCMNNWAKTGAFESAADYIAMNFEGLKDNIIFMLGGGRCDVSTTGFENDPAKVKSKDDILTLLIHLGYLGYDIDEQQCFIPNKEVAEEMENAVKSCNWSNLNHVLLASKKLLRDTLDLNEEAVAHGIEITHDEETSILSYNDENSLACVLSIAYYYAKNDYVMHRELATGKGFADIVFIPRRKVEKPALLLELKYDKSVDAAIDQIHRKQYPAKIAQYTGDILLVGINYDKDGPEGKKHSCRIEKFIR